MSATVSLRAMEAGDEAFVYQVYVSTRQEEMQAWGWPEAVQQSFLRMQYEARGRSYGAQWPGAESSVVLVDGEPAGTMVVWRGSDQIQLVDIALLPEFRSGGYGTQLLRQLARSAEAAKCVLRLSVARGNRAQGLYERLGFRVVREDPMYLDMERTT